MRNGFDVTFTVEIDDGTGFAGCTRIIFSRLSEYFFFLSTQKRKIGFWLQVNGCRTQHVGQFKHEFYGVEHMALHLQVLHQFFSNGQANLLCTMPFIFTQQGDLLDRFMNTCRTDDRLGFRRRRRTNRRRRRWV